LEETKNLTQKKTAAAAGQFEEPIGPNRTRASAQLRRKKRRRKMVKAKIQVQPGAEETEQRPDNTKIG
jgi:hypothetical protein